MSLKDNWKETGKDLGHAFAGFGKTFVRSAQTTADKVLDDKQPETDENGNAQPTVYSDGSWRKTGKDLGSAFLGLGKTLVETAKTGVDKAADKLDESKKKDENAQ